MSTDFRKSFKRVGGVALASVLMASCSQNWSHSDALTGYDRQTNPYATGKARMAAGQYGLAVQSFRMALAKEPGSVKALNALAATYDLLGRFDLAERYYREALNLDPKSVQSLNNLGYSYYLRGEFTRARELFERAAGLDAKNSVVSANLASLEKAQIGQQVAAAKRASKVSGGKAEAASSRTAWIERSDSKVQTLVTKADPSIVKAARERNVEPRVVHSPKPLIEISTAPPAKGDSVKPAPAMAAAVESQPPILKTEPKASRSEQAEIIKPVEVETAARITAIPTRDNSVEPGPGKVTSVPVTTTTIQSPTVVEPKSYALASPSATAPAVDADSATAGLPKLNNDVAHDVLAAVADPETSASAEGAAPVPPSVDTLPTAVKAPEKVDQRVDTAALEASTEVALPAPVDPVPAAPVAATTPAVSAPVEPVPDKEDRPVDTAALATKVETPRAGTSKEKPATEDAETGLVPMNKVGRIEISNGAGRLSMAARMGRYLVGHGVRDFNLTNAESFTNKVSVLYFKPGHIANAKSISGLLPVQPNLRPNEALETDLRLVLGGDLLKFDRDLISKFK